MKYKAEKIVTLDTRQVIAHEILFDAPKGMRDWVHLDQELVNRFDQFVDTNMQSVAINLSTDSIMSINELSLARLTKQHSVIVEWTEEVQDRNLTKAAAEKLIYWRHHFGIQIALDDAGAGQDFIHRTLLVKNPDCIKLDGSIVHGARYSDEYADAAEFIANFCQKKNIPLVAEWIETEGDYQFCKTRLNASYGQGFFF